MRPRYLASTAQSKREPAPHQSEVAKASFGRADAPRLTDVAFRLPSG